MKSEGAGVVPSAFWFVVSGVVIIEALHRNKARRAVKG
jgi:hypothetical protein